MRGDWKRGFLLPRQSSTLLKEVSIAENSGSILLRQQSMKVSSGISHKGKSNSDLHSIKEFIPGYGRCVKLCPVLLSYEILQHTRSSVSNLAASQHSGTQD